MVKKKTQKTEILKENMKKIRKKNVKINNK